MKKIFVEQQVGLSPFSLIAADIDLNRMVNTFDRKGANFHSLAVLEKWLI